MARRLDEVHFDPANGELPLKVYNFRQNRADRLTILDCVSLNRTLDDVTLVMTKRRPFDWLAERPFLKNGRGDWI